MSAIDRAALWGTLAPLLLCAGLALAARLLPQGPEPSLAQLLAAWSPLVLLPLASGVALLWVVTRALTVLALPKAPR
ncbi:hypothetical protein [Pseudooceanicola sp. HF7]|uniref:hypothetical protein n=1 Tax=Pseudooceanicola sp. HF7 TaxID=2721560 RepID=UPI00143214FC|nr:hypothetical protein [Pseudooceanicola sp. HF7]NIZ11191.1 hypothetical protein [Pseudooceanicola sp. HF7]